MLTPSLKLQIAHSSNSEVLEKQVNDVMFAPILNGEAMSLPVFKNDIDNFRKFLSINCLQA